MRSDLLPPEALEVLATVQSSVPPMSYDVIRAQVTRELGAPPEEMFERFEPEAFAAASLGQVHRAVLPAGDEVVVKIQYPGVEATVVQDLRNVRALLQTLSRIGRAPTDRWRRGRTADRMRRQANVTRGIGWLGHVRSFIVA